MKKIWDPKDKNVQEAFKFVCKVLLPQVVGYKGFKSLIEDGGQELTNNVDESNFGFIYHELEREYKNYEAEVEAEREKEEKKTEEQGSLSDLSTTSSARRKKGVNRRCKGGDEERQNLYLDWTNQAEEVLEMHEEEINKAFAEIREEIERERIGDGVTPESQKRKKAECRLVLQERERMRKKKKDGVLVVRATNALYRQQKKNNETSMVPAQIVQDRSAPHPPLQATQTAGV